MFIVCYCLK